MGCKGKNSAARANAADTHTATPGSDFGLRFSEEFFALRQEQVLRDSALHDRTARAVADGDPAPAPGLRAVPLALPRAVQRGE